MSLSLYEYGYGYSVSSERDILLNCHDADRLMFPIIIPSVSNNLVHSGAPSDSRQLNGHLAQILTIYGPQ